MSSTQILVESTNKKFEDLKSILKNIANVESSNLLQLSDNFKGSFYKYNISYVKDKEELMNKVIKYIQDNGLKLVVRISSDNLYISKNYAADIDSLHPPKNVLQELINNVIKKGQLSGKGYELYANPSMGIIAKLKDGIIETIAPVSGTSINISLKTGRFNLGSLEPGGWGIPKSSIKNYEKFIKEYKSSFQSENSPYPYSMFNLMGTAKMSFYEMEKLHFRSIIYPGTLHQLPLGGESGILDDIYNQTTQGCLFIGEGNYKVLTVDDEIVYGNNSDIRKSDIGILLKKGKIKAVDLKIGTEIKMRNGEYATLSLDEYGNQVWRDKKGFYVPFDSVHFDWNSNDIPQIVFMPPEFNKSKFINKDMVGKNMFVDNRHYYEFLNKDKISIALFPDRHNVLSSDKIKHIKKDILDLLKENEVSLVPDQINSIKKLIELSQVTPVMINIDVSLKFAKR